MHLIYTYTYVTTTHPLVNITIFKTEDTYILLTVYLQLLHHMIPIVHKKNHPLMDLY